MPRFEKTPQHNGDDWHIASLVVTTIPESRPTIEDSLRRLDRVDVHSNPDERAHKVIVIAEAKSEAELARLLTAIESLDGVLTANLIFHQSEKSSLDDILTIQPHCTTNTQISLTEGAAPCSK